MGRAITRSAPGTDGFPERLKTLRALRDVKQTTLAMRVGVHEITVSRWERGKAWPTLRQQFALCEALHTSREELALIESPPAPLTGSAAAGQGAAQVVGGKAHHPGDSRGVSVEVEAGLAEASQTPLPLPSSMIVAGSDRWAEEPHPGAHAWPPPGPGGEATYYVWDMDRRQFVRLTGVGLALSAFPFPPLQLLEAAPPPDRQDSSLTIASLDSYWQILDQCWALCNAGQLTAVDGVIQGFLPHVLRHATDRPAAAGLAAQSLRLLSVVRTHQLRLHEKIALNQQAVEYARQASDATILVAALAELAVAFKYADQPNNSFAAYEEALSHASKAAPLVRSRVYAASASAYAQRSLPKEAAKYLALAHQAFPATPNKEPNWLAADFGVWLLAFYEGLTHRFGNDLVNARKAFASYEHHPTASLTPERNRLEILNQQARVAVLEGDAEAFSAHLESAIVRSRAIQSRKRLDEAITIYRDEMPATWRDDPHVSQLADLIHDQGTGQARQ
jgi:DNA-binding XRE family transcriptional regulator